MQTGFCLIEDVSLSDRYCLPNNRSSMRLRGSRDCFRLPDIERMVDDLSFGVCAILTVRVFVGNDTLPRVGKVPSQRRLSALSWSTQAENPRPSIGGSGLVGPPLRPHCT